MKIGRNAPCPCGSGKKYKKCCLNKSKIQFPAEAAFDAQKSLKKDGQIKQCLHPNKDECTDKIVKAHAIQNNRILTKIAENGWVETLNGTSNLIFQSSQEQGRKIATTLLVFVPIMTKRSFKLLKITHLLLQQNKFSCLLIVQWRGIIIKKRNNINVLNCFIKIWHPKDILLPQNL